MNNNISDIIIFVASIFAVIFFIKVLYVLISKPSKLPPGNDHHDHIFFDDDYMDFDD